MCNIILTYQFGQLLRVRIPRVGTTWRKKFFNVYPFIYFIIYFLAVMGLHCYTLLSPVVVSGDLPAMASLITECGL